MAAQPASCSLAIQHPVNHTIEPAGSGMVCEPTTTGNANTETPAKAVRLLDQGSENMCIETTCTAITNTDGSPATAPAACEPPIENVINTTALQTWAQTTDPNALRNFFREVERQNGPFTDKASLSIKKILRLADKISRFKNRNKRTQDVLRVKKSTEPRGDFLNWIRKKSRRDGDLKLRFSRRSNKISNDRKMQDATECFKGMDIEDIDMESSFRAKDARDRAVNQAEESELISMMQSVSLPADGEEMCCENDDATGPGPMDVEEV